MIKRYYIVIIMILGIGMACSPKQDTSLEVSSVATANELSEITSQITALSNMPIITKPNGTIPDFSRTNHEFLSIMSNYETLKDLKTTPEALSDIYKTSYRHYHKKLVRIKFIDYVHQLVTTDSPSPELVETLLLELLKVTDPLYEHAIDLKSIDNGRTQDTAFVITEDAENNFKLSLRYLFTILRDHPEYESEYYTEFMLRLSQSLSQ